MRLRQAVAGGSDTEVAIMRVAAQAVGFEILLAIVADGDALLRTTQRLGCRKPARGRAIFSLAALGFNCFSRCGFRGGLAGGAFARRRFFLRGGPGRGPRCRLLLGHRRSPFPFDAKRLAQFEAPWARRASALPLRSQCSRNTPSTVRSSAGLISLEWATVTENKGPSSSFSQKERKSFSAGNFGNRS